MAFDCRFLRNPYWDEKLRGKTGQDQSVQNYIQSDERYEVFFEQINALMQTLLPAFKEEGKAHLTVGLGCTGGQHRSVFVAEELGRALERMGWKAQIQHRELERRAQTGGKA